MQQIISQLGFFAPIVLFAIATFLVAETVLRNWAGQRRKKTQINTRLRVKSKTNDNSAAYVELLKQRGLTDTGDFKLPVIWFNKLVMQSGASVPIYRLLMLMATIGLGSGSVYYLLSGKILLAILVSIAVGVVLPIAVLHVMRSKRQAKFEEQLPEAVDVMVRSMRAGHPLPVAIAMVGREMPDPAGTEFGLVADEMTYGLDLDGALTNMRMRVAQGDLSFLVVAVSIQATTGGNLSELLGKLSNMIRERARMRRKVKSLSAEGRFSAIALSIIPIALFLIISFMSPTYYGDIRDDPAVMPVVYIGASIWVTGIFIMYRMVNFKV